MRFGTSLPCTSVATVKEAETAQVALCVFSYDGRYVLPGFLERSDDVMGAMRWAEEKIQALLAAAPSPSKRAARRARKD